MLETEAKFLVGNIRNVEKRLKELGAELCEPRTFEKNIRYDQPDHSLSSRARLLRLRTDRKASLTYKGPSENQNGVMIRNEIEIPVDDPIQADLFLKALGYEQIFVYEKYRTTYEYLATKIMFDELPMGDFIEIESVGEQGLEAIRRVVDRLGFAWRSSIPMSYHELFEGLKRSSGFDFPGLTFDLFKGLTTRFEDMGIQYADQ